MTDNRLTVANHKANKFGDDYERAMCRCALESVKSALDAGFCKGLLPDTLAEIDLALSMLNDFHGLGARVAELEPFIGNRWVLVRQRRMDRDTSRYNGCDGTERQVNHREYRDAEMAALGARVGRSAGFVACRVRTNHR